MKVLHFFKTYLPDTYGGIERSIYEIVNATLPFGVESKVLSLSRKPKTNSIMLDTHEACKSRLLFDVASTGFSIDCFAKFRKLSNWADIINYHYPWPYMDVAHLLCGIKKPSVVTYHSDIVKQGSLEKIYNPIKRKFLSDVDRIVATSPNYVATSSDLQLYGDKLVTIPIGMKEQTPPRKLDFELFDGFPEKFFLFVGVFRYYKGLDSLLAAAKLTNLPIVLLGNGPLMDVIKNKVIKSGLANVFLMGEVSESQKYWFLEKCLSLVFPSNKRSEAYGLSLIEASMFGKPMITCEIGTGTSYINVHGNTGYVVPPDEPIALSAAMQALWDDEALAENFGSNARLRYVERFRETIMAQKYFSLYKELLD